MFVRRRLGNLDDVCRLSETNESGNPSNGLKILGDTYFLTGLKVLRKTGNVTSLKVLVLTSIAAKLTGFKILSNLGDVSSWVGFKGCAGEDAQFLVGVDHKTHYQSRADQKTHLHGSIDRRAHLALYLFFC